MGYVFIGLGALVVTVVILSWVIKRKNKVIANLERDVETFKQSLKVMEDRVLEVVQAQKKLKEIDNERETIPDNIDDVLNQL